MFHEWVAEELDKIDITEMGDFPLQDIDRQNEYVMGVLSDKLKKLYVLMEKTRLFGLSMARDGKKMIEGATTWSDSERDKAATSEKTLAVFGQKYKALQSAFKADVVEMFPQALEKWIGVRKGFVLVWSEKKSQESSSTGITIVVMRDINRN